MSEPNDDLLKALADLMYQGQDSQESDMKAPAADLVVDEPQPEDFLSRLAACERIANAS